MLIDARFMICRLLHPEAFKRIMATLDDFADPPPIQPFVLSSQLSTRAVENNSSWLAHYGALADYVKAKKLTSSLPPYTSTIRYYPTFGQVSLPGGVKLSSKMREDKRLPKVELVILVPDTPSTEGSGATGFPMPSSTKRPCGAL